MDKRSRDRDRTRVRDILMLILVLRKEAGMHHEIGFIQSFLLCLCKIDGCI